MHSSCLPTKPRCVPDTDGRSPSLPAAPLMRMRRGLKGPTPLRFPKVYVLHMYKALPTAPTATAQKYLMIAMASIGQPQHQQRPISYKQRPSVQPEQQGLYDFCVLSWSTARSGQQHTRDMSHHTLHHAFLMSIVGAIGHNEVSLSGHFLASQNVQYCTPPVLCKIKIQCKFQYKEYTLFPRPCMLTTCNGWMTGSQLTGLHMQITACLYMSNEDTAASINDCKTHRRFWGK